VQTVSQLADYNRDSFVDAADYSTWRSTYGSTTNLAADGNGDDVVDAADYTVWRDSLAAAPQAAAAASSAGNRAGQAGASGEGNPGETLQDSSADLYVISESEVTMQGGALLFTQDLANGRKSLTTPAAGPQLELPPYQAVRDPAFDYAGPTLSDGLFAMAAESPPAKLELTPEDASQQREHQLALDMVLSEFALEGSPADFFDEQQ
jgi:hypothetical protein